MRVAVRRAAALSVAASLLVACGGHSDDAVQPGPVQIALPQPKLPPASPTTPAFLLKAKRSLSPKTLREIERLTGVQEVTSISSKRLRVEGPERSARLEVGSVEPISFRNVAPAPTRDADFVWSALVVGEAVPTFDAAERLGVSDRATLTIAGTEGFEIGAFAENGVPNVVDVLVQSGEERRLPLGPPREFVIGARERTKMARLRSALRRTVPNATLRPLIEGERVPSSDPSAREVAPAEVQGTVQGGAIGTMRFEILKSGFIRPDPAWVAANIVQAEVPILGTVTCHRLLIPRLGGALAEIVDKGLAEEIDPQRYGGCYVPRFIGRDPTRSLSNHAFGLAVDLNTTTNQYGTKGDMSPEVVEIFRRWGFNWGGFWSPPDPMHFEAAG